MISYQQQFNKFIITSQPWHPYLVLFYNNCVITGTFVNMFMAVCFNPGMYFVPTVAPRPCMVRPMTDTRLSENSLPERRFAFGPPSRLLYPAVCWPACPGFVGLKHFISPRDRTMQTGSHPGSDWGTLRRNGVLDFLSHAVAWPLISYWSPVTGCSPMGSTVDVLVILVAPWRCRQLPALAIAMRSAVKLPVRDGVVELIGLQNAVLPKFGPRAQEKSLISTGLVEL